MVGTKRSHTAAMQQDSDRQQFDAFADRLDESLLQSIPYDYPTPVQSKVLTELRNFRDDCLVQAKTGTGKTIAFLLPALQSLITGPPLKSGQVGILILSPTRELAAQIAKECDRLTAKLPKKIGCHTAFGGTAKASALQKFMSGEPTVLVATPGRLKDILSEQAVRNKFKSMRTFVLDEADTMLEQGFLLDVQELLRLLPKKSSGWQGMCFSATIPPKIHGVVHHILKPGYTHITTVSAEEVPTIDSVPQHYILLPSIRDTFTSLLALLTIEYDSSPQDFKCLVFATTANGTALLYSLFSACFTDLPVWQIHSRMSQPARTRSTQDFKAATSGIMFASDVVGRGMDFPDIHVVIQVGLPSSSDQYVHRVGRTARAGKSGKGILLLTQAESFFLAANKQLPITPYPIDITPALTSSQPQVSLALTRVDETTKRKAYQAWLGYHKTEMKKMRLDAPGLVRMANEYAFDMGCAEPPMIEKKVVGKMGLKGVQGLRVGAVDDGR